MREKGPRPDLCLRKKSMSLDLKFDWHLTSTKIIITLVIGLIWGGKDGIWGKQIQIG